MKAQPSIETHVEYWDEGQVVRSEIRPGSPDMVAAEIATDLRRQTDDEVRIVHNDATSEVVVISRDEEFSHAVCRVRSKSNHLH